MRSYVSQFEIQISLRNREGMKEKALKNGVLYIVLLVGVAVMEPNLRKPL